MLVGREVRKKPVYDSREVGVPPIRELRRWGRESYGRIDFVDRVRVLSPNDYGYTTSTWEAQADMRYQCLLCRP